MRASVVRVRYNLGAWPNRGSAVLDEQNRLTGLLFAGSDSTTIINRIEHVVAALGVAR